MHPFAFLPRTDDSGVTENLHVMREVRLTDFDMFLEFASALLACLQQFKNLQTILAAKSLEDIRVLLVSLFQNSSSYQNNLI